MHFETFGQNKEGFESNNQERKERETFSIVLVDLQYPYGKNKVYLSGSLCALAARLIAMGHRVRIVDLNIDSLDDQELQAYFKNADIIGVSVVGAPYIPGAIKFAHQMSTLAPNAKLAFGGQVIKRLEKNQFEKIFEGTGALPVQYDLDLAKLLECKLHEVQEHGAFNTSYQPVWDGMGDERLKAYLKTEMTLVIGQGCAYQCNFCAADKDEKEQHREVDPFESDVRFLAESAKQMGITELKFYASSLDFFQHPQTVVHHLEALARVRQETGIDIKTRCLSCLISFVNASKKIEGFADLLQRAGLYCVGFGVDGTKDVWASQNKNHNREGDIRACLDVCKKVGINAEVLLVMGYSSDNAYTLRKLIMNALQYIRRYPFVGIRPYVCKSFVPGNKGWDEAKNQPAIQKLLENPDLFYNLDFAALASELTDSRRLHRFMTNTTYMILLMTRFLKRSPNFFFFPQGGKGIGARVAKTINSLLPTTD